MLKRSKNRLRNGVVAEIPLQLRYPLGCMYTWDIHYRV